MNLRLIPEAVSVAASTFDMEVGYYAYNGYRFPRLAALGCSAMFIGRAIACTIVGHRFEDMGHAGPDSGCIEIVCTRCGYSHGRVTLY